MSKKDNESIKESEKPPPSLDLAFDWVKGVLYDQKEVTRELFTRLAALFSIATLVLGVGLPVMLSQLSAAFKPDWSAQFILAVVAVVMYCFVSIVAAIGFWPRLYTTLDDPATIKKSFLHLSPWKFKQQILIHVEKAYVSNEKSLRWRQMAMKAIIILVPIETMALALGLLFGLR